MIQSRLARPGATILNMIRMGRPLFLLGGATFHLLGLSAAMALAVTVDALGAALLQLVITAIQLMTHYANEYFDRGGDFLNTAPTPWSGGSQVLPQGLLPPRAALIAALACGGVAIAEIAALMTITRPGPLALPLLIAALLVGWFYSAPPIRLVGRGLGEAAVAFLVPGVTAILGFYVQANKVDALLIALVAPLIFMQFAAVLAVASPDLEADQASGKRTLIVFWGRERSGRVYALALAMAYLALIGDAILFFAPVRVAALSALLTLPFALPQIWRAMRGGWRDPSARASVAFWSIAVLIGSASLEAAALAWLTLSGRPVI